MRFILLFTSLLLLYIPLHGSPGGDTVHISQSWLEAEWSKRQEFGELRWRMMREDNPAYANPLWDDSTWPLSASYIPSGASAAMQGKIAWFRMKLATDTSLLHRTLAFTLDGYGFAQIFLDGVLVETIGNTRKDSPDRYIRLGHYPVFFALGDTATHVLAVRYEWMAQQMAEEDYWGFFPSFQHAGDAYQRMRGTMTSISLLALPLGSVFATLFIVHLLLFLFYKRDVSNLYFALFGLGFSLFCFTAFYESVLDTSIDYSNYSGVIITACSVLSCYSLAAFCTHLFVKRKIFLRLIAGYCLVLLSGTLLFYNGSNNFRGLVDTGLGVLALLASLYAMVVFIVAMVRKMPGARILGVGVLFAIVFIFSVLLIALFNQGNVSTSNTVLGFVFVVLGVAAIFSIPLSITAFLAWRFADTNRNLEQQLQNVAQLSLEKQGLLEDQNTRLERQVALRTEEIVAEKKKSDDLLLNILPAEVAEELKQKGNADARNFNNVTVLFSDFVNFTHIAELLNPKELVAELHSYFRVFDEIMERHGLEKIKTIGDAYLAVSGLPVASPRHAQQAVLAAMDMIAYVGAMRQQGHLFDVRIGINSGSLVAGIVGVKKFAYDIWGDTVNMASRMESASEAGKINISGATYALIQNDFACTYRGKVLAKNKGDVDMYFVERKKEETAR